MNRECGFGIETNGQPYCPFMHTILGCRGEGLPNKPRPSCPEGCHFYHSHGFGPENEADVIRKAERRGANVIPYRGTVEDVLSGR